MLILARASLRALRPSAAPSSSSSFSSSRTLTSLATPATHSPRCSCARCAPRSSPISSIVRAPTQPGSIAGVRAASRLAPSEASHPRGCGCQRCAPRAAPAASGIVGVPARPSAVAPTTAARTAVDGERGMKVKAAVKKLCSGCQSVRRQGTVFILCSLNPKHKQRQG
ncbi:hypothetical protein JCM10450v2_006564 [Rhodotorula kratochvilovae]